MSTKPFGAPSGHQPFLPGPQGRYGRGPTATAKPAQAQQSASTPSDAQVAVAPADAPTEQSPIGGPVPDTNTTFGH